MTYQSSCGKQEGLRARIDDWIQRLSTDKALPWVGLGLIDDLKAVGREMDNTPDRLEDAFVCEDNLYLIGEGSIEKEEWDL